MTLSTEETRLMRHALGLTTDGDGLPYRNRFHTSPDGIDAQHWRELARRGLAIEVRAKEIENPKTGELKPISFPWFYVTAAGMDALGITEAMRSKLEGYERGVAA